MSGGCGSERGRVDVGGAPLFVGAADCGDDLGDDRAVGGPREVAFAASYGRAADTILTNHLTKVFYTSASDLSGLELAGRLVGEAHVPTRSVAADPSGRKSTSESSLELTLAPPHVLRQMLPGDALLVHGTLPPAHLRTRPYYRDRKLEARARGEIDEASSPARRLVDSICRRSTTSPTRRGAAEGSVRPRP